MSNHLAPVPSSNRYADLYLSDLNCAPVFEELVISKTINPTNTYFVVPTIVSLDRTPTTVLNKCRKTRGRKQLDTIQRAQSYTS